MKTGADLIKEERLRQIEVEGYDTMHDCHHNDTEFVMAALAYLACNFEGWDPKGLWPWEYEYFKPTNLKRNLVKAGALIAAAIDRMEIDNA